mmetsp:Transcript_109483/g.244328  ORF Transcript_109483/g.244328 Transcript_109483/m.244328 type:complete len:309 (-) Transcript_109483:59-985(-)
MAKEPDDAVLSEPGFGASAYGFDHLGKSVLYEIDESGTICTITLNTPEKANSMTPDLIQAACAAIASAASDPALRVVILTGAGRAFCAGGDVKAFAGARPKGAKPRRRLPPDASVWALRADSYSAELLRNMNKVTIAAINGACAGAGLSWACACDIRFAVAGAKFTTAFANVGLTGDFGGTWTLPRIVGPGKAREMYLLSDIYTSEEMERWGAVSKVLPDKAALMAHTREVAQKLADRAPVALQRIKANLNDADTNSFAEQLNLESERHAKAAMNPENGIAAAAFVAKKRPDFSKVEVPRKPWMLSRL